MNQQVLQEDQNINLSQIKVEEGKKHMQNGRNKEAIACLDEAIKLNYRNSQAHAEKGYALYWLDQHYEAIKSFDEAILLGNQDAVVYYNKGRKIVELLAGPLADLRRYQEAIQCYDQAIKLEPAYTHAYVCKGGVLFNQKRYHEAIQCYDQAIKIDPKFINSYNGKEIALRALGQKEEADKIMNLAKKIQHQKQ